MVRSNRSACKRLYPEVGEERESLIAEVAQMIEAKAVVNAKRMATIESTCKTIKTEASDAMHDLRVDLREVAKKRKKAEDSFYKLLETVEYESRFQSFRRSR